MALKQNKMECCKCPVCLRPTSKFLKKRGHKIYKCCSCGLFFYAWHNNPTLDSGFAYPKIQEASGDFHSLRWGQRYFLTKEKEKNKSIFDIGCGSGNFILACRKAGFTAEGSEMNPEIRKFASDHGITVYEDIDDIPENSVDFVTMWEVIEHLKDPNDILQKAFGRMKKGARWYIETPNWAHSAANNTDLPRYWPPYHLLFWKRKSLINCLEMNGFKVIKVIRRRFSFGNIKKKSVADFWHEVYLMGMELLVVAVKE